MTFRRLTLVAVLWCAWLIGTPAAERHMPVSEIKPGMVGIGRTVFQGETLEDFKVHILGVLRNTTAPGTDLILARLEGGPLAKTGVIAGMSGSPVYIDGRLIGAVSYSLGSFPTEPIAGITPIAEMLEGARSAGGRIQAAPVSVPEYVTHETFVRWITAASASAPASSSVHVSVPHPGSGGAGMAAALTPIATPLTLSGLDPAVAGPLLAPLMRAGFIASPAAAGGATQQPPSPQPLRPGSPVGVTLVDGDYSVGATGTVTDVVDGAVYAFGHPFFGLGPTRLPMTTAYVQAILPSLMSSVKISSTGAVIGTFTQDRSTVLAGRLGTGPDTIPVALSLTSADGRTRSLRFSMIEDAFFTPLLGFVAVGSTLSTFERDIGANTYAVRIRFDIRGQSPVVFDDVFSGDGASTSAGAALSMPLAALITNDIGPVVIEKVSVDVKTSERTRSAVIQRVWLDTVDVSPGKPLPVKILLRPYRGPDEVHTVMAQVPVTASGPLTLVVADGARISDYERRDGHAPAAPASLPQLVSQLQRVKRNNKVYVRLYARDSGALVAGEPMPSLPDSVLAVMDGDRASGGTSSIASAAVGAWDIPFDFAVSGMRTLTVTPRPAVRRP